MRALSVCRRTSSVDREILWKQRVAFSYRPESMSRTYDPEWNDKALTRRRRGLDQKAEKAQAASSTSKSKARGRPKGVSKIDAAARRKLKYGMSGQIVRSSRGARKVKLCKLWKEQCILTSAPSRTLLSWS